MNAPDLSTFGKLSLSQFLLLVLLVFPITILIIYEYLIASDRYESSASVYITEEQQKSSPFDLSLLGITNAGSSRDILVLKAFIESQGLLDQLDKDIGLLAHYSSTDADFISRLTKDAPKEEALEYYNVRVTSELDEEAQLLKISVQTFDAAYSKLLIDQILYHSQRFIDELNESIKRSQLLFFEGAVKTSEDELIKANQALRDFQLKNKIFSTDLATKTIAETIAGLEQQLATKQAELKSRLGALSRKAPTVIRVEAEISALQEQIERENERLAGSGGSSLSSLDTAFREIRLRIEYKTLRYKANLDAFEQAQLDIARRLRFLTVVAAPTRPDSSLYPDRLYIVITGSILALMLYLVVGISISIMKEHS